MADKTTTALTAGTKPTVTDLFYGVQGGNSRKWTGQQVLNMGDTAFPGSPASGDRFPRTDRNVDYFHDGTRWLSKQVICEQFGSQAALTPATASFSFRGANVWFGLYDIYVERVAICTLNSSANTTLNYFTAQPLTLDGAGNANIGSAISTSGNAQNNWVAQSSTPNVVVASTVDGIGIDWTEVGTVTALHFSASIQYRLIG